MSEADDRIRLARDGSWIIWEDPQLSELMDDLFAAVDERNALREEIMKTWFVLKEAGSHPGRTDDKLGECVRRVVDERDALRSQIKEWMIANGPGGWIDAERQRVAELEQKLQDSATEARYLNDWRKWQERNR